MTYLKIVQSATVEVFDHKNLRAAWRQYGATGVVRAYRVTKPLTATQLRRLPAALRSILE